MFSGWHTLGHGVPAEGCPDSRLYRRSSNIHLCHEAHVLGNGNHARMPGRADESIDMWMKERLGPAHHNRRWLTIDESPLEVLMTLEG